jgi:CRP-like cAMP-binding protein
MIPTFGTSQLCPGVRCLRISFVYGAQFVIYQPFTGSKKKQQMNYFTQVISQYVEVADSDLKLLDGVMKFRKYKAGDIILREGKICDAIMFIVSGKARSFFINHRGQEFTWSFHFNDADSKFENYFLVDYNSFLAKTPTNLTFEAIEDIEVIVLSYSDIQKVVTLSVYLEKVISVMSATAYQRVHNRAFSFLTLNAKDRYLQLLNDESYLLDKFQHYLISSYLGVAPQSLSRIRKEIISS